MPLAALPPSPPAIVREADTTVAQSPTDSIELDGVTFSAPDSINPSPGFEFQESMLPAREGFPPKEFDFWPQRSTIEAHPLYQGESGVIMAQPHTGGIPPSRNMSGGRR